MAKAAKSTTSVKKTKKAPAKKPVKKVAKAAPKTQIQPATAPSAEKLEVISQFATRSGDTGSPEVQIALLSKRIEKLVSHLKLNPSDNHSRRGLLGIVSKRRRLIHYLSQKDEKRHTEIMTKLHLLK